MKKGLLFFTAVVLAASLFAGCQKRAGEPELSVQAAWARPGKAGENSAVYFTIDNRLGPADTLLSVSSDAAELVELHASQMDDSDTMTMKHQEKVPIPAGEQVVFEPGGLHVMLTTLTADLRPNDTLRLTLAFENAGSFEVEAAVREP